MRRRTLTLLRAHWPPALTTQHITAHSRQTAQTDETGELSWADCDGRLLHNDLPGVDVPRGDDDAAEGGGGGQAGQPVEAAGGAVGGPVSLVEGVGRFYGC